MTFTVPANVLALLGSASAFLLICCVFLGLLWGFLQSCNDKDIEQRDETISRLRSDFAREESGRLKYEHRAKTLEGQIDEAARIFGWADDEEGEGELYAFACTVIKGTTNHLLCCLIRAASRDEAMGKALRIAEKKYPAKDYSDGRIVTVEDVLVEPEPAS